MKAKPRFWWVNPWRYVATVDRERAEEHERAMRYMEDAAREIRYPESKMVYPPVEGVESIKHAQTSLCDWCRKRFVTNLVEYKATEAPPN